MSSDPTQLPPRPPRRPWCPGAGVFASAALHGAALGLAAHGRRAAAWACLGAGQLFLGLGGVWPRATLFGPNHSRLPDALARRGLVSLTFDDGPDPEVTPRVLELLDEAAMGATFFVIGERVRRHPGLVAEIAARGHRVENHSDSHPVAFSVYQPKALSGELDRSQEAIAAATGRWPLWFRAPAGVTNPWVEPLLASRGLWLASWTRRGYDTVDRDPGRVTRRLVDGLGPGEVLLLHDGSALDRETACLEVLPRVLEVLVETGLRSVSLPDPEFA